ncbi:hypothetical protein GCM10022286_26890 [Gryllotalpicola daejeonensis]|jgi:hypothetical protein|uniref:Uncharacterized protein n=1 Tax=Gryllotalpicola daejeonensis TaxID=993087 RepID=A0ABP7ZMQ1_9MICO
MNSDEAIVAELRRRGEWQMGGYGIAEVLHGSGHADLMIENRRGNSRRLTVDLPSSGKPQRWLYTDAADAADWVDQFFVLLGEEIDTGGLSLT